MKAHRLTGAALLVCAAALAGTGPAPADAELVARLMSFFGPNVPDYLDDLIRRLASETSGEPASQ